MVESISLRAAWEAEARDWIAWARSEVHDHAFWRMNLPTTLALLPEPGELTVDLGCGEGRVARAMRAAGHRVVGIEGAETLARAAREADPDFDVHVADAAAVPLADACCELVVCSLMLMNVDDLDAVVAEAARILRPGGRLVASVLHPVNTWGDAGEDVSWFDTVKYVETVRSEDVTMTFHDTHRPLQAYTDALTAAGLLLERVVEPQPSAEYVAQVPWAARWLRSPGFLHWRALKP